MHIAGGADRLVEFLSQLHNLPVQILQISDRADLRHLRITDHKFIVACGLNLQVIIKFDNSRDFFFRTFIYNSPEKLSCFTGRPDNKSLPVFCKNTLWYSRTSCIIIQMRQ